MGSTAAKFLELSSPKRLGKVGGHANSFTKQGEPGGRIRFSILIISPLCLPQTGKIGYAKRGKCD